MTAVSSSTSFPTPESASNAKSSGGGVITDKKSLDETYGNFLKMLTTQLQHQDPTSPMDTAQFTNQLVSFSMVEQQLKSNANLEKLVTVAAHSQTQLGLNYIGLNVSMKGNAFNFDPATLSKVGISYNLDSPSASTKINIVDTKGNVVYSTTGSTSSGDHTLTWNGKKDDGSPGQAGTFYVQIVATDAAHKTVNVTTQVPGKVTGIQTANDGSIELVIDNTQAVAIDSVTSAWLPGSNSVASNNNGSGSNTGTGSNSGDTTTDSGS